MKGKSAADANALVGDGKVQRVFPMANGDPYGCPAGYL
jgi:hypothetical protein